MKSFLKKFMINVLKKKIHAIGTLYVCVRHGLYSCLVSHFIFRLLRFDNNEPGRQLKQPPAAFLEADLAEVRPENPFF